MEAVKNYDSFDAWFSHIAEYQQEWQRQMQKKRADREAVAFMTMHASKGLEYPIVYIVDANEEITPHKKAVTTQEIEEERRLFYVAMTRAKNELHICSVKERYGRRQEPSRFIGELLFDREKAKEKGIRTYLATNPVFPKVATMNRIKWAGLDAEDFELITTYEDNCYCKPNVDYYRTILEQFHLRPEECLMVGNDVEEDLAIRKLGVKTFLVTDTKENKKDLPIESDYQGSMEELFAFVESLENA